MFTGFSAGERPKSEESESWDELFATPNTEEYLKSVRKANAASSNTREQSHVQARSSHAHANSTHSNDHSNNRVSTPLIAPPNTATRDGDVFSSTSSSHFGSVPNRDSVFARRVDDAADELQQMKIAATVGTSTRDESARPGGFRQTNAAGFGGFGEKMDVSALKASAAATSTTVSRFGGAFAGFKTSGSDHQQQSKASASTVSVDSGATFSASTVSHGGGAFTGFGDAAPESSTTAPAPRTTAFAGFKSAAAAKQEEEPKPKFTGFGLASDSSATVSPQSAMNDSVRATSSAVRTENGLAGLKKVTLDTAESRSRAFAGFGARSESSDAAPAPAPRATAFTGFGTASESSDAASAPAPRSTPFTGFGSTNGAHSPIPSPDADGNVQVNFGTLHVSGPAATINALKESQRSKSGAFTGFGAGSESSTTGPAPTPAPRTTAFTGFQSAAAAKQEEEPKRFTGFGSTNSALSPIPSPDADGNVQVNFGTLHVSGPAATINALKEKERSEKGEKENVEAATKGKKKVHFEDVADVKRVLFPEEETKPADSTADETDDDSEPLHLYPWGKRPSFRTMLEGGKKKLMLVAPPPEVCRFFVDQVYSSYGCTYDNASNTFFATSPGDRGRNNGTIVALSGSCQGLPLAVAGGLAEPAAIAVYQQGLSVCVVTNRGIFVFERKFDEQRDTVGFLSRQISLKGFHRGIAATAGGGIVSFHNGRIRLFDGKVDNGQESVLAEVNYEQIINNALFPDNQSRRMEKANCCFMDIVNNRLVMSDLQKHVISLWDIEETPHATRIHFVCATDVAITANQRGKAHSKQIPPGKCVYASGIRLDADGWVVCADADGRTIQIFDDQLKFVTRVESPMLPYISGLYIESGGHMIVCDRRNDMGGLRVYCLEAVEEAGAGGFAAAAKQQLQKGGAGGRF